MPLHTNMHTDTHTRLTSASEPLGVNDLGCILQLILLVQDFTYDAKSTSAGERREGGRKVKETLPKAPFCRANKN